MKASIVNEPSSLAPKAKCVQKGSPTKKIVPYSKDTLEDKKEDPEASKDSSSSYLAIDRDERTRSPRTLELDDSFFKQDRDSSIDVLAIARNGAVDYFRVMRWDFHEINHLVSKIEPSIANWKLVKVSSLSKAEGV